MRTARLPVVDWTDLPADLNRLVRFAERRNLVSARVPSHFNWPLQYATLNFIQDGETQIKNINSGKCSSHMFTDYLTVLWVAKTKQCGTVHSLTSKLEKKVAMAYLGALLLSQHFREEISQKILFRIVWYLDLPIAFWPATLHGKPYSLSQATVRVFLNLGFVGPCSFTHSNESTN
jgi:hypothetical protein